MSERPHEQLFTRALGGLFLPTRPQLSRLAGGVLVRSLTTSTTSVKVDFSGIEDPTGVHLVHRRPPSGRGRFAPDLCLFREGDAIIRAVIEVKLHAKMNVTEQATLDNYPLVDGVVPSEPEWESGRRNSGIPQLDAYVERQWWRDFFHYEQALSVDATTIHILATLDGESATELAGEPIPSNERWLPLDLRRFVSTLMVEANKVRPAMPRVDGYDGLAPEARRQLADLDESFVQARQSFLDTADRIVGAAPAPSLLSHDEYNAVVVLVYLIFAADERDGITIPEEWVANWAASD